MQADETANNVALDGDISGFRQFGQKQIFPFQSGEQGCGAPVNKAQCKRGVKGIRKPVFYFTRLIAPIAGVFQPVFTMGGIGPRPDHGKPVLEAGDIWNIGFQIIHALFHGGIAKPRIRVRQRFSQAKHKAAMALMARLSKVRQTRQIPEAADLSLAANVWADAGILSHPAQHPFIKGIRVLAQDRVT